MAPHDDDDHDDDHDDDCHVPGCPVHDPQAALPVMARVGVRLQRHWHEPLPGTTETATNRQPFEALILLACTGCQAQHKWVVPGHHVATVHRLLGQILEKYPQETEELVPDGPEVQTAMDKIVKTLFRTGKVQ